ncbi:hypothetical protein HRW18_17395 [Streptomyces lunaelactis]|uniref:hypothetical protein n=1 Tax=Streptomyces lunaelactis TaxID=1535768 RepID=UPI0015858E8F|nr:hypothetical protein [Streptomyces lunaelactis]NUK09748.1 hypothetical protein [Streptomyces lunaelactis]
MSENPRDLAAEQQLDVADFDAFFTEQAEQRAGVPLKLYGREYVLPTSLPLLFTLQMERLKDSADPDDIRKMLASLFGPDALDAWAEHGMTDRQLGVVLVWSTANCRTPGAVSMAEAARLYDEREGGTGKAPANRAERRTKNKGRKPATSGKR